MSLRSRSGGSLRTTSAASAWAYEMLASISRVTSALGGAAGSEFLGTGFLAAWRGNIMCWLLFGPLKTGRSGNPKTGALPHSCPEQGATRYPDNAKLVSGRPQFRPENPPVHGEW